MRIAISGLSGCGNSTVSKMVAEKLGMNAVNYTKRNMAAEDGLSFSEWYSKHGNDKKYDFLLDARQIELAKDNTVLGSRLAAALIDADLRIWLHASLKTRAERIAKREGKNTLEALKETRERDKKDINHYKKLYGINLKKHEEFVDLVINTERYSAEEVAQIICSAAKTLPSRKNKKAERISKKIKEIIKEYGFYKE